MNEHHTTSSSSGQAGQRLPRSKVGWTSIPDASSGSSPKTSPPDNATTATPAAEPPAAPPAPPSRAPAAEDDYPGKDKSRYLRAPDGLPPATAHRSPPVTPFRDPLVIPPLAEPTTEPLSPAPDPAAHQRYQEFAPKRFYQAREQQFQWRFHSDYGKKTWTWGVDGSRPGPTIKARYGEPLLVRRHNELPAAHHNQVPFAQPSTVRHLHNGHTAPASDGYPDDWCESGEFQDHHYGNFPATSPDPRSGRRFFDEREKLTTLWYHDQRAGASAANVYAGLLGCYVLHDDRDSGDENDPNPDAWRLPSGDHDVPLMLQDLAFDADHQLLFDGTDSRGALGDRYTVNGVIQPHFTVRRRKYRFRVLNASLSRHYELYLNGDTAGRTDDFRRFIVIGADGGLHPEPVETTGIYLAPGQRADIIVDFSSFADGTRLFLENRLEQVDGAGPSGRDLTGEDIAAHRLMRFDVAGAVADPSRVPDFFRPLPVIDPSEIVRKRRWVFDQDGGLWTVNGRVMDSQRIEAGIEVNTAEQWTFATCGTIDHHPVHSRLSLWLVQEINGVPCDPESVQVARLVRDPDAFQRVFTKTRGGGQDYQPGSNVLRGPHCGAYRRDIANLGRYSQITMFARWPDFTGRYVVHSQNLVHADVAMMARWDVVAAGQGFDGATMMPRVYDAAPPGAIGVAAPAGQTIARPSRMETVPDSGPDRARGRARSTLPAADSAVTRRISP